MAMRLRELCAGMRVDRNTVSSIFFRIGYCCDNSCTRTPRFPAPVHLDELALPDEHIFE